MNALDPHDGLLGELGAGQRILECAYCRKLVLQYRDGPRLDYFTHEIHNCRPNKEQEVIDLTAEP